jgi:hypothetical protein|tara:strand:+ start:2902 stop:4062 length:1161 start_codon:yes stop_codon:yes gene_type:complete
MLNLGLGFNSTQDYNPIDSGRAEIPTLGRVYDIVLDENHPSFEITKTIGAIRYNLFDNDNFIEDTDNLYIAYPQDSTARTYPLKNEVVVLNSGPRESVDREDSELKVYYSSVISIWNASNHNAAPPNDAKSTDLGKGIKELDNINILLPNSGDHIIDGRCGNSIRLGGYKGSKNILTDNTNDGKPYTIISNGRPFNGDILKGTAEDINKDNSSIYFTSNHTVPLEQSSTKLESNVDKTVIANKYKGAQILINSDRLVFNSKKDDIIISSKESLTTSAKDVGIDGKDYISLDAKKIYLGSGAKNKDTQLGSAEPVVLGHRLEDFLQILVDELKTLSGKLRSAKTVDFKAIPNLNGYGVSLKFTADILQGYINPNGQSPIKSRKTFTE